MKHPIFLAADIGATKTNIGLYMYSQITLAVEKI
jgi:hypothetical protein